MEQLSFLDVAKLVNRIGTIRIVEEPSNELKGQWALYQASIQVGGIKNSLCILYLMADATVESTREAKTAIKKQGTPPERTQVVYPPSLKQRNPGAINAFESIAASTLELTEYFTSFILQQTENYLQKISALNFNHYVDPHIKISGGFEMRAANPVLNFLTDPELKSPMFNGALGVLLAEPGQGKTFMSRYLANQTSRRKFIPIYVHAEQWSRMQQDEISSIWKTITHSFRYFESPIGWIDGAEEEFLKVALKAGLFRVIFDGFDEYVLWNKGKVDALETIQSLQSLTNETGARILITTRTSFWESEVQEDTEANLHPGHHLFVIKPFDKNRADNYFKQRFSDDKQKQDAATKLFVSLKEKASDSSMDFVGRGFFLFLIADLIERDFTSQSPELANKSVLQWIMKALCQRERVRQDLPLTEEEQLRCLSEFAEFLVCGEDATSENLKLVIQGTTDTTPAEIDELVLRPRKLKDHPLIRFDPSNDRWHFVQNQLMFALLADRLIKLSESPQNHQSLLNLVRRNKFDLQLQNDVASAMADQLFELKNKDEALNKIREIIQALLKTGDNSGIVQLTGNPASLATTLALLAINKSYPKGSDRKEKTKALISLFPDEKLSKLNFSGTLARFDFEGYRFEECNFHQVSWANCVLNSQTIFSKCTFSGGNVLSCEKFGHAQWESSCIFDADSKSIIDAEIVRAGKRNYSIDDLKSDITQLIKKFSPKDGLGLRSVEERNLTKGIISASIYKNEIVEGFKRRILEPHSISGSDGGGYHVNAASRDAMNYYSTNGVFTGSLAQLYDELRKKLISE